MEFSKSQKSKNALEVVLATDCGSTTTKAILFEKKSDGWHATFRGEAPTTVEKPLADVTIGAINAFTEVEELSGRKILDPNRAGDSSSDSSTVPFLKRTSDLQEQGIDLYVSTSSAGGGLQMIVAGVVSSMTTESAERAALGAGAIVMDAISADDGREPHEKVQKIRHLRPDIILIAGGVDGGTIEHPLELAEIILQADPRPRFGETLTLPVIYAANKDGRESAREILGKRFDFVAVDNLRPTLEQENLAPARDAIHELFLNHVMSHAPGYSKLLSWSPVPIIPTPAAVGQMVFDAAKRSKQHILAVDIGGATTDVFSVFSARDEDSTPVFNRTVSANLGMSYSVANVLLESGEENVKRWLPFELSNNEIRDRLRNKMIRPTTIPHTLEDLILEQALCREALRLAFHHHKRLAVGLKGVRKTRSIADMFSAKDLPGEGLVDMMDLDLIIGSGGVLSHAPDRKSAALMLIDAYEPVGVTKLAVDSVFMMPHLGVLSTVHAEAATEVFLRDCLIPLGTVIAPLGQRKPGQPLIEVHFSNGDKMVLHQDELLTFGLAAGEEMQATITCLSPHVQIAHDAKTINTTLTGGCAGIILDGRGRPLSLPTQTEPCIEKIQKWYDSFNLAFC